MRVMEVLQRLFCGKYGCEPEDVTIAAALDDLNIAPHERQDMAEVLAELYGVEIAPDELMAFATVEDIVGYVEDRLNERAEEQRIGGGCAVSVQDLRPLMTAIGYQFRDASLLEKALTHSSYTNEGHGTRECYERLEFLGDSLLGFITARYLYEKDRGPGGGADQTRGSRGVRKSAEHLFAGAGDRPVYAAWPRGGA